MSVRMQPDGAPGAGASSPIFEGRSLLSQPIEGKIGLREEMRALKVDHILRVASQLFVERGFVGTTMDAIAEQLDMSKPFIYQFFKTKHAILVALYDRELRSSLQVLSDASTQSGSAQEQLTRFVRLAVSKNVTNQALTNMLALEEKQLPDKKMVEIRALESRFNGRLKEIVIAGVASAEFQVNNPSLAARAIMGMLLGVKRWYRASGELTADEIAEQFCEFALRTVGFSADAIKKRPRKPGSSSRAAR